MATVQDPNLDQNNTSNTAQQPASGAPISVSGNSSSSGPGGYKGGSSASSGGATSSTTNAPSSSGQFQNLQSYLGANQNYINQGGLAGQLSSDYNKQAQGVQNNITDASQNWYGQNSSKDIDPNAASTYVGNTLQDPSTAAQNPNSVSQFQNYLNAGTNYSAAPATQFDPTQTYQNQVQNYQSQVSGLGTNSGRQAALQQMYDKNNPYYSQGQQSLDNLILGAGVNANGVNQLQNLQNNAQGYGQNLQNVYNTTTSGINGTYDPTSQAYTGGAIQQYANDANQAQTDAQNQFNGSVTGLYGKVSDAAGQDVTKSAGYQNLLSQLSKDQIDPEMAAQMGINLNTPLYNVDPSKYLSANTATLTNIITPDQQKQMDALSTLGGNFATGDASTDLSKFKGNTEAGTFNPYNYDASKLNQATTQAGSDFVSGYKNIQDYFNNPTVAGVDDYHPSGNILQDVGALQNMIGAYKNPDGNRVTYNTNQTDISTLQQLQALLGKYNVNPSGQAAGWSTNFAAPSASTGPSIGDSGVTVPVHGNGGAIINPLTGLPISHSG